MIARRLLSILTFVLLAVPLAAQQRRVSGDTLAVTSATITIREKPFADARALAHVAAGTTVRLYTCSGGWCGVRIQQLAGYALEEYLRLQPAVATPTSQGRGYVNSNGEWVPSPTRTADGQPPAGATAQCRDGTYSFSKNRRGTCSHHGGVVRWLR
jgi:hypothetical protein